MPFGDILKDGLKAGLRYPGNGQAAIRRFRELQAQRKADDIALVTQHFCNLAKAAFDDYRRQARQDAGVTAWRVEYVDAEVKVKQRRGFSWDNAESTVETLVTPRDGSKHRLHVVITTQGRVILNEWHDS